jgi:microcystin-dependent protein
MGCSNCFNGCAETISDKCVKYTGVDIPELEIVTGDPLLVVENKLINKFLEVLTGEGIIPDYQTEGTCSFVTDYLPSEGDITLNDVLKAYMDSLCDLNFRVLGNQDTLLEIQSDYDIDCLEAVTPSSGVHDILQATIDKLCTVDTQVTNLIANVLSNYVLIADIDSYIASYLASIPSSTLVNAKFVPYVAVAYFGPLTNFDLTGAGIGTWEKIYLCNGQNSTPDLRGRTLVGATTMGNTVFDPAVDPGIAGNPTYSGVTPFTTTGANQAFLTTPGQLPPHAHSATVSINDPGHTHPNSTENPVNGSGTVYGYDSVNDKEHYGLKSTESATTGITATSTIGSTGASEGHPNIQPVFSTNYIIYIP